jgi:hypothetical protein
MNVAVVSAYYNFTGSPFRYKNYSVFQKNIRKHNIKLTTVEFNPTGNFELKTGDADYLLQFSEGDIMWQKERLLNIGIDSLPADTDIVIIADTDIIFGSEDFVEKLCKTMEQYKVVQCFTDTLVLNPILDLDNINYFKLNKDLTYNFCNFGRSVVSNFINYRTCENADSAFGLAYAFRYDILKKIKLFDYNIIGGGDRLLFAGLFGLKFQFGLSTSNEIPYINYIINLNKLVSPNEVSYVKDVTVYSLYHGELFYRMYVERHEILKKYNFDPQKDLIDIPNLPYKFSKEVSENLKTDILKYFFDRKDTLPLPPCLY